MELLLVLLLDDDLHQVGRSYGNDDLVRACVGRVYAGIQW